MLIAAPDVETYDTVMALVKKDLTITELGDVSHYLGAQFSMLPLSCDLAMSMGTYLRSVVSKFATTAMPVRDTPLPTSVRYVPHLGAPVEQEWFQSALGSILYAANFARPDLSEPCSVLGQFSANPGPAHINGMRHLLGYIKQHPDLGIVFRQLDGEPLNALLYADADLAGDESSRRSRGGHIFLVGSSPVSWSSKLMTRVSGSTEEAEYQSLYLAIKSIAGLVNTFGRRTLESTFRFPIVTLEDNMAVLHSILQPGVSKGLRHVELDQHIVKQLCVNSSDPLPDALFELHHTRTADQLADLMTKSLPRDTFRAIRDKLMYVVPRPPAAAPALAAPRTTDPVPVPPRTLAKSPSRRKPITAADGAPAPVEDPRDAPSTRPDDTS
jgi:hypothetical protein